MNRKIILASQSPRRKQLLEWAEIPFEVRVTDTDESFPADLQIEKVPVYIARNKANAIFEKLEDDYVVIAADTVVVLQQRIIGKPKDKKDAIETLSSLSGHIHQVMTGVVIQAKEKCIEFVDITEVEFHPITKEQIEFYVEKYKPFDKAGAYAIQEWIGVVGIKNVRGDFYNVMGLPVSRVVQALEQF